MPFLAKMTKMPLVNLELTEGQNPHKIIPFIAFHQTRASRRFLTTLTKFDLKLTLGELENPNFDPAIGTG